MKFTIATLALAAFIGFCIAAPSTQSVEKDAHVSTDTTSDLIESVEGENVIRLKKSPEQPKTLCVEAKNSEGISFLQCADNDSELAGSASYSSYSAAPSYGASSGGYGDSSGGYKVT